MAQNIAAIDQGTTSSRCIVFDKDGAIVSVDQREHEQITPRAGWVEHDPREIMRQRREVPRRAPDDVAARRHHQPARDDGGVGPGDRRAGLQRDRLAGHAHGRDRARARRPRPAARGDRAAAVAPTSAARRSKWILDNVDGARERAENGDLLFGTMDTLGAVEPDRRARDGRHEREPHAADGPRDARVEAPSTASCSASRSRCCPRSARRSEHYGECEGVPVAGILGDQQAALFGQTGFDAGRRQEHLRHRLVPARQHGRGGRAHARSC